MWASSPATSVGVALSDLPERQRHRQLHRGRVAAQQPAAYSQRELLFRQQLGIANVLAKGGHPAQGVDIQLGDDFRANRPDAVPRGRVGDLLQQSVELLEDFLAAALVSLVLFDHLADRLEDLAGNPFGRELFQLRQHHAVLAGAAAELHFRQQPLGTQLPQRPNRRRHFLGDVRVVGKRLDDGFQLPSRLGVTLALQAKPGNLLAMLEVLGVDLTDEDLVQYVAGNRAGGHPHVPHVGDPFHFRPTGGNQRDALDDVDRSLGRVHAEDPPPKGIERLDLDHRADTVDRAPRPQHPLTNGELLFELAGVFLADLADLAFGNEGPPQVVVQQQDQPQRAGAVGLGCLGDVGQAGDHPQLALQDPPVLQQHLGGRGRAAAADPSGQAHHERGQRAVKAATKSAHGGLLSVLRP